MKAVVVLGVLLMVVALVFSLMYVGWLPRPRRRTGRTGVGTTGTWAGIERRGISAGTERTDTERAGGKTASARPPLTAGEPRALTLAWVEGTYLSTRMATSRRAHVAATGLGARARANMVVDDSTVRWEREGLGELRVPGSRLLGVDLRRARTDTLVLQANLVLVSWRAENGDRNVTGFLPRSRTDSAALVSAVQRLMTMCASSGDLVDPDQPTPRSDTGPQIQTSTETTTPEGTR